MNRIQAARLTLSDGATVFARWQSFWIDRIVTWSGQSWDYQPFSWEGLLSGQSSADQLSLTVPATPSMRAMVERALAGVWLATLDVYQLADDGTADSGPPAGAILVGSAVGEVVGASGGLTSITVQLGSALSPVGAQFPPRTATTPLIGVPCRL